MKRIVIMGATSGIGREVARSFIKEGWTVGAAGRNAEALAALKAEAPESIVTARIDVQDEDAPARLHALIGELGGMDVYLHSSGIGKRNMALEPEIELETMRTNGEGWVRMVTAAYNYLKTHGGGRLAAISSIAGVKGLGTAAAYSATKRMQNCYLDALAQLSHMEHDNVQITDIRPGFVATPLLAGDRRYPMQLTADKVAREITRAIIRGRRRAVIDWRYRILVFFWRLIPEWLWERLTIKLKN